MLKLAIETKTIFLHQAVNMFISALKFGILTWAFMGIALLLEPASSGH
ncbi:hypothetical protein P3388_25905 [Vibrio parahaemolyticus]|nr:hypothetical protein [Vibrio parahaemolyticus]